MNHKHSGDAGAISRPGPAVPFILAGCTAVSVLSTDLITPSIPDLPRVFSTDIVTAQLVVSVNLFAYATAQLVHGPLAEAVGRRRLMLVAFSVFVLVSAFCAVSVSMPMLLTGRFLQGIFSSVPSVVIILIIRELYSTQQAVRVMALYGAALGLAPAVGPLVGGYLQVWFGWSAGFWVIAVLAAVVLALFRRHIPETLPSRQPFRLRAALVSYGELLARPAYVRVVLPLSLIFGALYAFVATAPVVFIDLLGLPTERYGLAYVMVIIAFILGNVATSHLSGRMTPMRLVQCGALLAQFGGIGLAAPSLAGIDSIPLILVGMSVYAVGLGIILAAGPIVLLDTARDLSQGAASALLGSLQLGAAALAGYLSASFYDHSSLSMSLTVAGFALAGGLPIVLIRQPATAD